MGVVTCIVGLACDVLPSGKVMAQDVRKRTSCIVQGASAENAAIASPCLIDADAPLLMSDDDDERLPMCPCPMKLGMRRMPSWRHRC